MQLRSITAALLLAATSAFAQTYTANPSADAFVITGPSNNLTNNNYGGAGALHVAPAGLSKGEAHSFVQFNLAPAKAAFDTQYGAGNWTLTGATLQFTSNAPNNSIFNGSGGTPANAAGQFNINWISDDSWTEGSGTPAAPGATGINWTNQPATTGDQSLGSPFSFPGGTTGNNVYTLAPSSGFLADLYAGSSASLRLTAADAAIAYTFASLNNSTAVSCPVLTLTAVVPEPASLAIFVSGVGALLARRRKA